MAYIRKGLISLLFVFTFNAYGQDIALQKQYYYANNGNTTDTICCLKYDVKNSSLSQKIVMFTEDDINTMPIKELIRRKCFRRYGDFSLSSWAFENIVNESEHINAPDFFVKIIPPNGVFTINILLKSRNESACDNELRKHVLLCDANDIDNEKMIDGFMSGLKTNHADYPYDSITMTWETIEKFIHNK